MDANEDALAYWCAAMAGEDLAETSLRYRPTVMAHCEPGGFVDGTCPMAPGSVPPLVARLRPANGNGHWPAIVHREI